MSAAIRGRLIRFSVPDHSRKFHLAAAHAFYTVTFMFLPSNLRSFYDQNIYHHLETPLAVLFLTTAGQ